MKAQVNVSVDYDTEGTPIFNRYIYLMPDGKVMGYLCGDELLEEGVRYSNCVKFMFNQPFTKVCMIYPGSIEFWNVDGRYAKISIPHHQQPAIKEWMAKFYRKPS